MGSFEQVYEKLEEFSTSLKSLQTQVNSILEATNTALPINQLKEEILKQLTEVAPQRAGSEKLEDTKNEMIALVSENHATIIKTIVESENRNKGLINKAEKRIHIALKDFHKEIIGFFQTLIEFETASLPISVQRKKRLLKPYYLYFDEYASILGLYEDDLNTNVQSLHYLHGRGTKNSLVHLSQLRDKVIRILDTNDFDHEMHSRSDVNEILALIDKVEREIDGEDSIPTH